MQETRFRAVGENGGDVFAGGVAMEQYEAFLEEALRLTDESDVPSVVYPFLERQQAKLNEDLITLIPTFATHGNIRERLRIRLKLIGKIISIL